jgi:undecaprenyl-phosphate galactose phosphotransferase
MVLITISVMADGGPALFRQMRIGQYGRPFKCFKFRTMAMDSDRALLEVLRQDPAARAEWITTHKLSRDPRITTIGRFLRKTSLDELPQLVNVLRGEMSLVGPRPIVASEVPYYGDLIRAYYAVRPGITGLWQISGGLDRTYARRVQLDVWYATHWSLVRDLRILLKTVPAMLMGRAAF